MSDFPFPDAQKGWHRFHALVQGTFIINDDNKLTLKLPSGEIPIYPTAGAKGGKLFHAARSEYRDKPDVVVDVYGYPRTDETAKITGLQMVCWHESGTEALQGSGGISRQFEPNRGFLCGQVRSVEDGFVKVKVSKHVKEGEQAVWWFVTAVLAGETNAGVKTLFKCGISEGGHLMAAPLQSFKPPVREPSTTQPRRTLEPRRRPAPPRKIRR